MKCLEIKLIKMYWYLATWKMHKIQFDYSMSTQMARTKQMNEARKKIVIQIFEEVIASSEIYAIFNYFLFVSAWQRFVSFLQSPPHTHTHPQNEVKIDTTPEERGKNCHALDPFLIYAHSCIWFFIVLGRQPILLGIQG